MSVLTKFFNILSTLKTKWGLYVYVYVFFWLETILFVFWHNNESNFLIFLKFSLRGCCIRDFVSALKPILVFRLWRIFKISWKFPIWTFLSGPWYTSVILVKHILLRNWHFCYFKRNCEIHNVNSKCRLLQWNLQKRKKRKKWKIW